MKPKKHVITIDDLRKRFMYDHKGIALLRDYGAFQDGLTRQEVDDYLRVRANTMHITAISNKFYKKMGAVTCSCVYVEGKEYTLIYRHDVKRYADNILLNVPTYFD